MIRMGEIYFEKCSDAYVELSLVLTLDPPKKQYQLNLIIVKSYVNIFDTFSFILYMYILDYRFITQFCT